MINQDIFDYTFTTKNRKGNQVIAQDLSYLSAVIVEKLGDVIAVILEGSYGRGEGGVVYKEDRWYPVNDYDICVVTDKVVSREQLQTIKESFKDKSSIWRIDIDTISPSSLVRLKPTMKYYDRKYGSIVLYGDKSVLDIIPEMKPESIPLREAEKEYFTRMASFIVAFKEEFLRRPMTIEEIYFMRQQLSKALITCANAYLILTGRYHISFSERQRRFLLDAPLPPDDMKLINEAFQYKLQPTYEEMENPLSYYYAAKNLYFRCLKDFVEEMYHKRFLSWGSYARSYLYHPRKLLLRAAILLLKRTTDFEKSLRLNLAQLFLVLAQNEDGKISENKLANAIFHFKRYIGNNLNVSSWEQARSLIANARLER